MNDLVYNCTEALEAPVFPACGDDYGVRVVKVFLAKETDSISGSASDYLTAAELETAIGAGYITVIEGIVKGHKKFKSETELSGDDTESGGREAFDRYYTVEDSLRRINSSVREMCEKLDKFKVLRAWILTEKNYLFGGKTGYRVAPAFKNVELLGVGTVNAIDFTLEYLVTGTDDNHYDADYETLVNET
jgi:hypothetical protein